MNLAYRASQFLRTFNARPRPRDLSLVEIHLSPSLLQLYLQMNPADQVHGIRVLRTLLGQGENRPFLLAAALLHDVGKIHAKPRLWGRVLVVLFQWLMPNIVLGWGEGEPEGWRRPFIIAARHPQWSAELIRNAGGGEDLIELVRRHQQPPPIGSKTEIDHLLHSLQTADSMN